MDAIGEIRRDLTRLKRRRRVAASTYVALLTVFVGALLLVPPSAKALARNAPWAAALALIFATSTIATAAAIGLPLWSRRSMRVLTGVSALALAGALLFVVDWNASSTLGAPCFVMGTVIAGVAMAVLGVLSGQLWRRFPDPGLLIAVGVTGVGVAVLHFKCGGSDPIHLLAFHLTPLLLIYGIARLAVRAKERLLQGD